MNRMSNQLPLRRQRLALDDVLDYIEDYYVLGRRRGRGRTVPMFPVRIWNCYERTLQGLPRTNNSVEGWNRRFNSIVSKSHPGVFSLLEALRNEENYAQAMRVLVGAGGSPPRKKKKNVRNVSRLERLLERYDEMVTNEGGILGYLRAVGHSCRSLFASTANPAVEEDEEEE